MSCTRSHLKSKALFSRKTSFPVHEVCFVVRFLPPAFWRGVGTRQGGNTEQQKCSYPAGHHPSCAISPCASRCTAQLFPRCTAQLGHCSLAHRKRASVHNKYTSFENSQWGKTYPPPLLCHRSPCCTAWSLPLHSATYMEKYCEAGKQRTCPQSLCVMTKHVMK